MSKAKNIKFGKKFIAGILAISIVGSGAVGGFHIYKRSEINRVKGYLEDFLTEDNYVDLSKISTTYDIKNFDGEYLDDAITLINGIVEIQEKLNAKDTANTADTIVTPAKQEDEK